MSSAGSQYSLDQLYDALRQADASGNSADARAIAAQIAAQSGGSVAPAQPSAPTQIQGPMRLPLMAGSALVKGAAGLLGLPGDLENLGNEGINALRGWVGSPVTPQEELAQRAGRMPTSGEIENTLTNPLGLTNNPHLVPQTPLERYGSALVEAIPSTAAAIGTGGAELVPGVLAGASGALGSEGAHELAPDSSWAPVVGGLAAGLGVGGASGMVENALNARSAGKAMSQAEADLQAAKDQAFTGNKSLADNIANLRKTSKADFAQTRSDLADALKAHNAQQDSAIETVASGLGKSQTLQDAGTALQTQARDWINKILPAKLEALWKPVNEAIPSDAPTPLISFHKALEDINTSAGKLEPIAGLLKPGAPSKLLKAFDKLSENPAGVEGEEAQVGKSSILGPNGQPLEAQIKPATEAQPFTWGEVQKLRSTLGDAMSNPKVIADVGAKNLSRLYATLTSDMRSTAADKGATDLFDQANKGSTALYDIAEGPMSNVVASGKASAEDPNPEAVAKGLLAGGRSGASDLATLRQEIPRGVDELAAAHLRQPGDGFAKLSPEATRALIPDPNAGATALGAMISKGEAQASYKLGVAKAQQDHQTNMDKFAQDLANGRFEASANIRSSQQALREAKARLAAQKTDHSGPSWGHGLLGSALGNEAAVLGLNALGAPGSDIVHGAMGSLLGVGIPKGVSIVKNALKEPQGLIYPGLSAAQGANAQPVPGLGQARR